MRTVRSATTEGLSPGNLGESDFPDIIMHIGAGNCAELDSHVATQAKRIVLVEADSAKAKGLSRRTAGIGCVEVFPFAVGAESSSGRLKVFNFPDWNSLRAPLALKGLFPGLRLLREMDVEIVSIVDLIEKVGVEDGGRNWLVIDAPGSEMAILETLCAADRLASFERITLRCGRDPLYEGAASASKMLVMLHTHGYESMASTPADDPELICNTLRLSPFNAERTALQERIEALLIEREEQAGILGELREKLQNLDRGHEQVTRELAASRARLESVSGELSHHRQQVSELTQMLESVSRERDTAKENSRVQAGEFQQARQVLDLNVSSLRAENARLSRERDEKDRAVGELREHLGRVVSGYEERGRQLREQQAMLDGIMAAQGEHARASGERGDAVQRFLEDSNQKTAELLEVVRTYEKRLEYLEKGVKKDLVRSIANSTRQIESRIGIESYLSGGYAVPAMGGWAASADISLFLIRLIESRSYDLIIEFGSGISTVLMAGVLCRQNRRELPVTRPENGDVTAVMAAGSDDRPSALAAQRSGFPLKTSDSLPKIITFEHQRKYFDETSENLLRAGVSQFVEMNYAPLRSYSGSQGEHSLYYACEERVAEISRLFRGRRARVLVFVDGPPGSTGKHARYPALPIVLQNFPGHELDILLDDHDREDEKGIAKRWEEMLSERSLSWEKEVLSFEKGALLLSVR